MQYFRHFSVWLERTEHLNTKFKTNLQFQVLQYFDDEATGKHNLFVT